MRHSGFPAAAARDAHAEGWNAPLNKLAGLLDLRGSAATLVLLGDVRSTYTRTVRMGLAEKGVAYTMQACGPHSPEVLAVTPFGRIPVLHRGRHAPVRDERHPALRQRVLRRPSLLPSTIADRARCEQWVSATNAYFYDTMARRYVLQYFFPRGKAGSRIGRHRFGAEGNAGTAGRAQSRLRAQPFSPATACRWPTCSWHRSWPTSSWMPEGKSLLAAAPHLMRSARAGVRDRASFKTTQPPAA